MAMLVAHPEQCALAIGQRVVDELVRTQKPVAVTYRAKGAALVRDQDLVVLTDLPIEDALRVLVVLGKSDEELEEFMSRHELISLEQSSAVVASDS